jgi:hypothetical protein
MAAFFLIDPEGVFSLIFFAILIVFVLVEAYQVARGRIHLRGIGRAALELLIVSPVMVFMIFVCNRIAEHFNFNGLEANFVGRWITCLVLLVVWVPWSHYRAQTHTRRLRNHVSQNPKKSEGMT